MVLNILTALTTHIINITVWFYIILLLGKKPMGQLGKLNFSGTESYKHLHGIYTKLIVLLKLFLCFFLKINIFHFISKVISINYLNVIGKCIVSQLSCWFSGAKDREGRKRERPQTTNLKKTLITFTIFKYLF